jgi:hypothetical protein
LIQFRWPPGLDPVHYEPTFYFSVSIKEKENRKAAPCLRKLPVSK